MYSRLGEHTPSQFEQTWSKVAEHLERELWFLNARHVVIEVDVRENRLRVDGRISVTVTLREGPYTASWTVDATSIGIKDALAATDRYAAKALADISTAVTP